MYYKNPETWVTQKQNETNEIIGTFLQAGTPEENSLCIGKVLSEL